MRREVLAEGVEVWEGDCREVDWQADHTISDLPYEDELHAAIGRIRRTDGQEMPTEFKFEGVNTDRDAFAQMIVERTTGWALIFTLAEGVRAWRDSLQTHKAKYDTCLAWVKPRAGI